MLSGPDFGGRVTSVSSLAEWDALLAANESKKQLLIVDCYALWCPPCKTAAPVFAKLSEEFDDGSCTFAKVDVENARDVGRRLGISAMPTFKVFKGTEEVEVQRGWPGEDQLKKMLIGHGAKLAKAD